MDTKIVIAKEGKMSESDLQTAGDILRQGGTVAFPTETVYGLGANGLDSEAASKIYKAKGRPSDNPLIIHIADKNELGALVKNVSESAEKLMKKFWPGPLTIIFQKSDIVPYGTTGGLETVAIRMPSHPVAQELLKVAKVPVAAPSANASGRPSPTTAKHVIEDLDGKIDMIVDGGQVGIGIESTIIDMSGDVPMLLRPGFITKAMLEEEVGEVLVDKVVLAKSKEEIESDDYKPKAPGMKYKHYAPKAELIMFEGETDKVVNKINELVAEDEKKGVKSGVICTDETKGYYKANQVISIGSRSDDKEIAHNLYGVLRDFDETDIQYIYSETFYDTGLGEAVMNRLIKAAGYRVENTC